MSTGISDTQLGLIRAVCAGQKAVERVILFGSRAKGTYKPGSDIDLAVAGPRLTRRDILALSSAFDDSMLPYTVDVVHYDTITNGSLRDHIDRVGVTLLPDNTAVGD